MTVQQPTNTSMTTSKSSNTFRTTILSVDLGRTATKACVNRDPNQVVFIPSNVKCVPIEKLRGGEFEARPSDALMDIWLESQGRGYALGQLAADFGADLGVGASKVENSLTKVLACVGYFGIENDVAIVLGLPFHSQDEFEQEKEEIVNLLSGSHQMNYRGQPISVNVQKVWVMPEGYGSLIWCESQEKADKKGSSPDFSKLSVAVVDIGHQTTDCLMVDAFRLARGASQSEAFGMSEFYKRVAAEVEKVAQSDIKVDSQSLTLINAVNRPRGERFFRPRGAVKPINLDDFLPNLQEHFARELSDRVVAWLPERVTDVILTGGGGEFFYAGLEPLLKGAGLRVHLAQPSRQANSVGQYLYAEAQLAAASSFNRSSRA
ncbi:ParM/StbA family protein [Oxynema sp. CENA135]|nr:ParM/StbA family protein [Oxynema sp. CENA135]